MFVLMFFNFTCIHLLEADISDLIKYTPNFCLVRLFYYMIKILTYGRLMNSYTLGLISIRYC